MRAKALEAAHLLAGFCLLRLRLGFLLRVVHVVLDLWRSDDCQGSMFLSCYMT